MPVELEVPQLLRVPEAAQLLGLTEAGLRHRLFHDTDSIRSRCAVRLGRNVRLRADRLAEWIDAQTTGTPWPQPWQSGRRPGGGAHDAT